MSELSLYRALQLAESNLRIGYAPRVAVSKAIEHLQVNPLELAMLLMEKSVECSKAREERAVLDAVDRLIDRGNWHTGPTRGTR